MNLPNYFLADLPPEATLSADMLEEACRALKRNREQYLAHRSTRGIIEFLSGLSTAWLDPNNAFRKMALEQGPPATGFSRQTLAAGLDSFFKQLNLHNFEALLEQDLGHVAALDGPVLSGRSPSRTAIASGPELQFHITAGNLPNPAFHSIVLGLLTRSAQFVKCASGASLLPRLFAHSIYDADPKLGACLELGEWRGGVEHLEKVLFAEADCITATGSDEALAAIRHKLPHGRRFLGHGHRVSFGFVSARALTGSTWRKILEQAASDVVAWNQLGCLSPHVIYVENGGAFQGEKFAEMLAEELARREETEPRGDLPAPVAAAIASRRSIYELRAANKPITPDDPLTRLWCSQKSTSWTVVFESDPRFQLSCLNRFIYVKPVASLREALASTESVRDRVSTVGIAASDIAAARELAIELARWGVTRVCPLGQMQNPPLTWRHDGRPALGELVRWTGWESE